MKHGFFDLQNIDDEGKNGSNEEEVWLMKEIPVPYLRANQTGIVTLVIIAAVARQPWVIAVLWVIQVLGLLFGMKANLFVQISKPFLEKAISQAKTEARELSRFNNGLAVTFLTISLLFFIGGWTLAGYIVAGILAAVAFIAICGFCLGCFLYFQLKMWKKRITKSQT
jgi:uncharacterized membrane protein YqgA involved in biofilm formation